MKNEKKSRKTYTIEFKEQAVSLAEKLGNISLAARQLDVSIVSLKDWVQKAKIASISGDSLSKLISDQERIIQLQKENELLRMENEIIKKATAYFAQSHLKKSTPGFKNTKKNTQ